jgi:HK97 family phage prohead protease
MRKTRAAADTLERKSFTFKMTKEIDETGRFEGYAAVFGNVDSQRDVIHPGAFKKTLQENPEVPILWQHDPYEPIGVSIEMKEDDKGLHVVGQLAVGVQRADEARLLMQAGAIKGLSIGYRAIKPVFNSGVRGLKEIALKEWSPVTFPSNTLATIADVKERMRIVKAEGDVIWDPEAGFRDLQDDIRSLLSPPGSGSRYWVQDIALDLSRCIVQDWESDKTWIVPFTLGDDGEPMLAPASDWIEAEEAWVQATPDKAYVKHWQALLDAAEPPVEGTQVDGAAVKDAIAGFAESLRTSSAA